VDVAGDAIRVDALRDPYTKTVALPLTGYFLLHLDDEELVNEIDSALMELLG
jgi:hypothetical protein